MNLQKKRLLCCLFTLALLLSAFVLPGRAEENRVALSFDVIVNMAQGGEKEPDFPLTVEAFDFSSSAEDDVRIESDTVYIRGAGEYRISMQFSVKKEYLRAFGEGFSLRMQAASIPGLTLSETEWRVLPMLTETDTGVHEYWQFTAQTAQGAIEANTPYFDNSYTAQYGMTTVEIPFTKIVAKADGSAAPTARTFALEVYRFVNEAAAEKVQIEGAVATNGVGDYNGMLKLTLDERDLMQGILEGGFYVREKAEEADGWTFSDATYFIYPMHIETPENPYGEVIYMVYDGSADLSSDLPQPLNGMYFTNTYSAVEQPPEPTPTPQPPKTDKTPEAPKPAAPKTGDASAPLWYAAACIGSIAVFAGAVLFGKRRRFH